MSKVIIGLVGHIASGKTTITNYLKEKHNGSSYRFSTVLRDIADRLYIEQNRENLQHISQGLREYIDQNILSSVIANDVKADTGEFVIVDGVRRLSDIAYLQEIPGFKLVHVFADMDTRYKRLTARSENIDDTGKTLEAFKADHAREAEQEVDEVAATASIQIDNNGTLEELYVQLDRII